MTVDSRETKAALSNEVEELRRRNAELEAQLDTLSPGTAASPDLELLHAVLDAVADGILAVDREGRVVLANKQFARMWHIPPDLMEAGDDNELLQFVLDQLVDPEAFLQKVRELYASTRDARDVLHFRDGRVFERVSRALAEGQHLMGRVWCFRDISPHAHAGEHG